MGWIIEAIANVCLELLGDLMAWTVNLVTGMSLDIGMDTVIAPDGTPIARPPAIGEIINPTAARGNLLESTFPQATSFTPLFMILGASIIMFLFLGKLAAGFGGPFIKSEPGGVVVVRTFLAAIGTAYSYSIFVLFESLFNGVYNKFLVKYIAMTKDVDNYALNPGDASVSGPTDNNAVNQHMTGGNNPADAFQMLGKDLIGDYQWGQGLALTVMAIALFSILLVSFMKLVLEIYERYVMLGVLFYVAPLAFATLVSREMNVCINWVKMVLSEFVVMCSNLFFTGVFIAAWHNVLQGHNGVLFDTPKDFVTTMFLMIAWLIIGQQFDQHLKSAGLATAQTGRALGGAVMAGVGTAALTARAAAGAIRTAGNTTSKAIKNMQAANPDLKAKQFIGSKENHPNLSRADANKALDLMQSGKDRAFNSYDSDRQGAKIMDAALASGGKGVADSILSQTGSGIGSVNRSSVKMNGNGLITGETYQGKSFVLHNGNNPANTNSYISKDLGNGWSAPLTQEQARSHAVMEAARQPSQIDGNKVTWAPDYSDGNPYAVLNACDSEKNLVATISTPHIMTPPSKTDGSETPPFFEW